MSDITYLHMLATEQQIIRSVRTGQSMGPRLAMPYATSPLPVHHLPRPVRRASAGHVRHPLAWHLPRIGLRRA